jgi:hypothetical protein
MATESPRPQPDEIPDDERTGDEPNPSGKAGKPREDAPAEAPQGEPRPEFVNCFARPTN